MTSFIEKIRKLELKNGELAIFWLGQNSFVLKTFEGTIFAIDPFLSRPLTLLNLRFSYIHPKPPIRPEDFRVHYIFCTHDHLDHTDPVALPIIAKHSHETIFFGPQESCRHLIELGVEKDRVKVLEAGIPYNVRDLKITAYHSVPPEYLNETTPPTTHFGYIFEVEGVKVYNMGDTCQSILRIPEKILEPIARESPDIAMLPIIGDTPERRPEDAYLFAKIIKPKIVIPCHYGCIKEIHTEQGVIPRNIDPEKFVQLFKNTPNIKPVVIPYKGAYVYKR
jgi:L-ascorbate 6-phosphate lactonase